MDRALDEVVRERQQNNRQRNQRRGAPRGGVRKPGRNNNGVYDESRLWVHDRFEGEAPDAPSRRSPREGYSSGRAPQQGARIRVENIHYELGEEELMDLFRKQGPVLKLELLYDRAGRSEGTAFVTYERERDAENAIRDYDGANANGQPITLTLIPRPPPPATRQAPPPPRSLFERIAAPEEDGERRDPTRKPTPPGIDRYVPPDRRRERGGEGRTNSGPRPVSDRGRGRRGGGRGESGGERAPRGGNPRPKKTVEELDAEMNDYFGAAEEAPQAAAPAAPAADDDEDMIL